jgi:hypothetical protein
MNIEKVRAIYWNSLPDNQEESYLYICYLFNYLQENPNLNKIVTADIEEETDGFINNIKLGRIIRALPTGVRKKKTSKYNKITKKSETIYAWDSAPIYNILLMWAVEPVNKEQLKNPNLLKELQYLGRGNSFDVFLDNTYKTFCLSLFPNVSLIQEEAVVYYDNLWKERYGVSYQHSNSFVRSLINYSTAVPNKRMEQDCLVINHTNDDGYALKSRDLLDDMNFLFNKDFKLDYLPTRVLSRLIGMVRYPFADWRYHDAPRYKLADGKEISFKLEAHHICQNRNCCNPAHIILSYKADHQDYHRAVGDDEHPTITVANDFEICPEVSVA